MNKKLCLLFFFIKFYSTITAPQQSEINDIPITDIVSASTNVSKSATHIDNHSLVIAKSQSDENRTHSLEVGFSVKVYKFFSEPIIKLIATPKVNIVLRNIGTCIVNGAMDLFSYYLPPTFMPLVASAAGFMIPFEPVVMLKERMPVNTYRRAFKTAMKSFLDSFSHFKYDDEIDPYMTRRFNRRFMDDDGNRKPKI